MQFINIILLSISLLLGLTSCSPKISTRKLNAYTTVAPTIVSYNELTMDLDPNPITYTIDVSSESGRAKLSNLSVEEADDLALIEAIMSHRCATIFNPQYTHLVHKGKVLRVTVYGYPARYKQIQK
ncbi:MAG: hypothetical protein K2J63_06775 [Muribaculaceae bacterium]|nr:hypothetical protein [Muribaculaceae bacterium]